MNSKEAFKGFNSKKFSEECNTSRSYDPKAKISLIGIRRRKNGRYAAAITDPIRHKEVWLGTFDTSEEASQAYFSKKSEFENENLARIVRVHKKNKRRKYNSEIRNPISKKRIWLGTFGDIESEKLMMQQQCTNKHTHSGKDGKSDELVDENLNCGSEIDVLISNSSNGGTDRRIDSHEIDTAEEGFHVYESKKKQVFLGTVKEASKVFNSCLMADVCGTKSSDECNNTTSCNLKSQEKLNWNPKTKEREICCCDYRSN